jgi:flagella basal body P-ring formation protein FlgA
VYRTLLFRLPLRACAALLLSAGMATSGGAEPGTALPPQTLARALTLASEAATVLAPKGARVVVEAGSLDPRLSLAPCARIDPYLPPGVPAWGRSRIGLRCVDGTARWNVSLPVSVAVWAPGVVARSALPAGARLEPGQLLRTEIDWAAAAAPPFDDPAPLVGRVLVRPLTAGQALRTADLQSRQWFLPGDSVRIVAIGPGYSVTGQGEALTAGIEGHPAKVQVRDGAVLTGRAVSERCIEVGL